MKVNLANGACPLDTVFQAIDKFDRRYPVSFGHDRIELDEVIARKELQLHKELINNTSLRDDYANLLNRVVERWERPIVTDFNSAENVIRVNMTSIH